MSERTIKFLQPIGFLESRLDNHAKDTIYAVIEEGTYEQENVCEDDEGDEYTDYEEVDCYCISENFGITEEFVDKIQKLSDRRAPDYYRIFELLIEEDEDGFPIGIKKGKCTA